MQHPTRRAAQLACKNFTSPHNRLAVKLLIVALLGLIGLSVGQFVGVDAITPIAINGPR